MSDVFISYSRKDTPFVRRLHAALVKLERDTWVDFEDIPPTADWLQEIYENIQAADTFVFVISPDSVVSPIANLEIAHAAEHNKRFVPIVVRETDENTVFEALEKHRLNDVNRAALAGRDLLALARDNWQVLARHNWIFFDDDATFERTFARLIAAIDMDLAYVKMHTRLLRRAIEWDKNDRDSSFLLRGADLQSAEAWLEQSAGLHPQPTEQQRQYIRTSRQVEDLERENLELEQKARQRLFYLVVGLGVFLVVAIGLTILAFSQQQRAESEAESRATQQVLAEQNAATAVVAQGTAIAAQALAERIADEVRSLLWANGGQSALEDGDTLLALALALDANSIESPPVQARRFLADVSYLPGARHLLPPPPPSSPTLLPTPDARVQHTGSVRSVAFSPDGQRALSGSFDQRLMLWDLTRGEALGPLAGHSGFVLSVAFSPDGQRALSGSFDNTLILWDVETREALATLRGHSGSVNSVAFSPDGQQALSASADDTLTLWNLATGEAIRQFRGHNGSVNSVVFNADGSRALSGSEDSGLLLWEVATGKALLRMDGHEASVMSVALSPDGQMALSGSADGEMILWDTATGGEVRRFENHRNPINSVAFSPDGKLALSSGIENRPVLWDVATGAQRHRFQGHSDRVFSVAFSPDGRRFLSGGGDSRVILWDVATGANLRRMTGHESSVTGAAFSPDGGLALSASRDNRLIVWDATTGVNLRSLDGHSGAVNSVAFSPDGQWALSGGCGVRADDATQAVMGSCDFGELVLWEVESGRTVRRIEGHTAAAVSVAYHPDGQMALSGSSDRTVILWDLETGAEIRRFAGHVGAVNAVAFSPDGAAALAASSDATLGLWDVATGELIRTFEGHDSAVLDAAFSADGRFVLSGGCGERDAAGVCILGEVILWDAGTGEVLRRLRGHRDRVNTVAFSRDGRLALSGSQDGTLLLWELEAGAQLRSYAGHEGGVLSVAFSPDGRSALSGSQDGSLILWRVDTLESLIEWTRNNRFIRGFTCTERARFRVPPLCDEARPIFGTPASA